MDQIADALRSVGIPFLLRFKNPADAALWMATEKHIPFFAFATLEFAFFTGGEDLAREALKLLELQFEHRGWLSSYESALVAFRSFGIPDVIKGDEAEMLAKSVLLLGLA